MFKVKKQFKKLIGRFKPPTEDELVEMDKWVPWKEVLEACNKLKQDYQLAEQASKERAMALMKYLVRSSCCGIVNSLTISLSLSLSLAVYR